MVGIFIHEHSCGVYIYISGNLNILSLIECNFVLFPLLVLVMILRAIFCNLNIGQILVAGIFPQSTLQYIKYGKMNE